MEISCVLVTMHQRSFIVFAMGGEANKMLEIDYDLLGHMAMDMGPFFKLNTYQRVKRPARLVT